MRGIRKARIVLIACRSVVVFSHSTKIFLLVKLKSISGYSCIYDKYVDFDI